MELIEVWKQMFRKIYRGEWCLLLVETSEDMKSRENIFKNEKIKKKITKIIQHTENGVYDTVRRIQY